MNTTVQVLPDLRFSPRLLGVLAVLMFAMTIPMTRLANGGLAHPQLPPLFVALGRGAIAGGLALAYLIAIRAPWPPRACWPWMLGVLTGGVLVFPVCMGWAVRVVPAWHASVITGVLPLITAVLAAWWMGQRPRAGFWLAGGAGVLLVLGFVLVTARAADAAGAWQLSDAVLLLGMLGASMAYVSGARATAQMSSAQVTSWALVWALPITVPGAAWVWLDWQQDAAMGSWRAIDVGAWWALGYVSVSSSWLGFFAWYAALARDPMRVSQIQLLQPFAAMALSAALLGEQVSPWAPVFAAAVVLTVWWGQRMARIDPQEKA